MYSSSFRLDTQIDIAHVRPKDVGTGDEEQRILIMDAVHNARKKMESEIQWIEEQRTLKTLKIKYYRTKYGRSAEAGRVQTPPAYALSSLLKLLLKKGAYDGVVEPQLSDLYIAYYEAISRGHEGLAKWIVIRDSAMIVWSLFQWPIIAIVEGIAGILRR